MTDLGNSLRDKKNNDLGHIAEISNEFIREKKEPERIIELAKENTKFFKDQYGKGYALVKIKDHYESIPLESNRFKWYLTKLFYDHNFGIPAHKENINSAIQYLQSIAEFESQTNTLYIRVAWSEDRKSIYYDLTDENWNCVRIDRNGVEILLGPEVKFPLFRRYSQTPQPIPEKHGHHDPRVFDKFMMLTNVKDNDDILLVKIWIISAFIPDIAHTIFNVHGAQGAAKTGLQRLVKQLVDPDKPENLLSVSHNKMEFIQQLSHRHVAFYDNLKYRIDWLAEEICKAVTGGGTSKRELFTNEGDIIFDFKVCLGFNGINMIMNEPDVLRRSILIKLEPIEAEDRISESQIFAASEELKPEVLGYIFDIVSKAMTIRDTIELKELPSMADFSIWGESISRAMGYEPMEFINIYNRNIQKQNQYVIDMDSLAKVILLLNNELEKLEVKAKDNFYYDKDLDTWSISTSKYLQELNTIAYKEGIDIREKHWPQSPGSLSYRLNILKTNLRSFGIDVAMRTATTTKDMKNGFSKNSSLVEIKQIRHVSGKDVKDGKDVFQLSEQNKSIDIEEREYTEVRTRPLRSIPSLSKSIITIPTTNTNPSYRLMLVYKDSQFLNHIQHKLRTCQYCGETSDLYSITNIHHCPEKVKLQDTTKSSSESCKW